jgi:hypothetical protein
LRKGLSTKTMRGIGLSKYIKRENLY